MLVNLIVVALLTAALAHCGSARVIRGAAILGVVLICLFWYAGIPPALLPGLLLSVSSSFAALIRVR